MNQEKIGKYIAEIRKQKNMTQKELAEKIGICDKTISKWECGNGMPDISYLESLCNSLDITVNELLSGESLSEQSYSKKAEENIMALMKENETQKKSNFWQIVIGTVLAAFAFVIMTTMTGEVQITNFLDMPSAVLLAMLCFAGILISGKKTKAEILHVLQKILIPSGVIITLFELVVLMHRLTEPSKIGPNLAVCILTPLYAVIAYFIVTLISERK